MSTHPSLRRKPTDSREAPNDDGQVFNSILSLVSTSQGADFSKYKPNTIHRPTQQRMAALRIASLAGYLTYLGEHSEEVANLSNHVLIPVMEFFRNPEVFEDLAKTVYSAFVGEKSKETIRMWVVACSSGSSFCRAGILDHAIGISGDTENNVGGGGTVLVLEGSREALYG